MDTFVRRVQGPFFHTNILGQWVTLLFLWLVASASIFRFPLVRLAMTIGVVSLVMTFSRAVWVVAPAASLLLAVLLYRHDIIRFSRLICVLAIALIALALFVLLAPTDWSSRFVRDQGYMDVREQSLEAGLRVIEEHPFFGVGNGNFLQAAELADSPVELRPHNIYVKVLAEHGVLVLLGFAVVLATMVREATRAAPSQGVETAMRLGVASVVVAWSAFMLVYLSADEYVVRHCCVGRSGGAKRQLGSHSESDHHGEFVERGRRIAATPGIDFDPHRGLGFVRFSFAGSTADVRASISRIVSRQHFA